MVKAPEWRDERKVGEMKSESVEERKVCIFSREMEVMRSVEGIWRRADSLLVAEEEGDMLWAEQSSLNCVVRASDVVELGWMATLFDHRYTRLMSCWEAGR